MVRKNKSKILIILFLLLLTSVSAHATYHVAILKSRSFYPFNAAEEKIIQNLRENKIDITFSYFNLEGDSKKGKEVVRKIKTTRPNLVLTIGTLATLVAKEHIKDIPIVFTMVLNPMASGVVSPSRLSETNITGVTLDVPPEEQLLNFRKIVPEARDIGVFYNPKESGIIIEESQKIAKKMGVNLHPILINESHEVPAKLERLKDLDGLWMVADSVVLTPRNIEFIILYTLKNKIPTAGISEEFSKAGTLFSKTPDLNSVYKQTTQQIIEILTGKKPSEIPIENPKNFSLQINLNTARVIGLTIPKIITEEVVEFFE